jgi:hypothetical protein
VPLRQPHVPQAGFPRLGLELGHDRRLVPALAVFDLARERTLKRWRREWKFELVEKLNPDWHDMSDTL